MNSVKKVLVSVVSVLIQKGLRQFISIPLQDNKIMNPPSNLFSRPGKHQKSPSVILPIDLEDSASLDTTVESEAIELSKDSPDLADSSDMEEVDIAEAAVDEIDLEWDPEGDSSDGELLDGLATDGNVVSATQKALTSDKEETGDVEAIGADGADDNTSELADDGVAEVAIAEDADPVVEDTADADVNSELEEAIAKDVDSEDTTELAINQDEEAEEAIAKKDTESEDTNDDETVAEEDEETESVLTEAKPEFTSGVFTVGASGEVVIDPLFDGGKYKGELGIFSLTGMDKFEPGSEEFIREAAGRALSNSTSGYIVFSDQTDAAKFSGELGDKDYNSGDYLGAKTFIMRAGDQFGFMLVANGRVQQVFDNPDVGGALRPLFSMATANPDDAFHVGQIADVTGNGNTFVMEDLRVDTGSDRDYNDIIFQVRGATGTAISLDEVIDPAKDWRDSELGKELIDYVEPEIVDTPDSENDDEFSPPLEIVNTLPVDPLTGAEYIPGSMMLKFDSTATETEILAFAQSQGAIAVENLFEQETNGDGQWKVLQFAPDQDLVEVRAVASQESIVAGVELDYKLTISNISRDSMTNSLWGLNNSGQTGGLADADIDLPEAWRTQTGSKAITVAVIDTGGDYRHPDLAANTWRNQGEIFGNGRDDDRNGFVDDVHGYDFVNRDGDPMDDQGHGTHVAGTIGAVGNNNRGVVGVNQNVSLMHLKFLDSQGNGSTINAIRSVDYATRMGADVINASFGGGGYSQAMFGALSRANNAGVLFVAAAGNEGNNNDFRPSFPANYDLPNVISVAATDHRDRLAGFSNFGRNSVDIGAPGVNILSTLPGNRYDSFSGTSMAAPHVAGAAALLLAENSNQTPNQVKNLLMRTADPVTSLQGRTVTGGRLNVNRALSQITTPQRPIWEVAIDEAYARSPVNLGRPLNGYLDATRSPQGTNGKCRAYEYGTIHWTPQHGAVPIWLDLQREYADYASPNGSGGWLGFPTKIEYPWNGGMRTDFEGGYIFWNGQRAKAYRNGQLPNPASSSGGSVPSAINQNGSNTQITSASTLTGTVNSPIGYVNVRPSASTSGSPIKTINNGVSVPVIRKLNGGAYDNGRTDWYEVIVDGKTAYIAGAYLSVSNTTPTPTETRKVNSPIGYVNVRPSASTSGSPIKTINNGVSVPVIRKLNGGAYDNGRTDWYEVIVDGRVAYIAGAYLSAGNTTPTPPPTGQLRSLSDFSASEKQQLEVGFYFPPSYGSRYARVSTKSSPKQWAGESGQRARYLQDGDMPIVVNPQNRTADQIRQIIQYFNVSDVSNKRYTPTAWETYCNIFARDVMFALRAPLPHWQGTRELDANTMLDWLKQGNGWRSITASEAAQSASRGLPALAVWKNPAGIGHIAVVRPSDAGSPNTPRIAQAGGKNFSNGSVSDGFGNRSVSYFVYS